LDEQRSNMTLQYHRGAGDQNNKNLCNASSFFRSFFWRETAAADRTPRTPANGAAAKGRTMDVNQAVVIDNVRVAGTHTRTRACRPSPVPRRVCGALAVRFNGPKRGGRGA